MDFLGKRVGDARHRLDVLQGGNGHRPGAAEVMQQGAFAPGADARHLVEVRTW